LFVPSGDPGGEAIVLVLSEVDGEHARLEIDGEPVGHVQHLLPLLHRRLKVLLLAQLLYLARLRRNSKLKNYLLTNNAMLRIRDVYPRSWILIFTHPVSRIQKQHQKKGVKKN
jgi:hypothetical protein